MVRGFCFKLSSLHLIPYTLRLASEVNGGSWKVNGRLSFPPPFALYLTPFFLLLFALSFLL
jgi:hypothetical protein